MKPKRLLSLALSLAMMTSLLSVNAFAADTGWKDGKYTGKAAVEPDAKKDFDSYDISVNVTVSGGKITDVSYAQEIEDEDNAGYADDAMEGTKRSAGMAEQIIANNGTTGVNVVSRATCTSKAIVAAVDNALNGAAADPTPAVDKTALQAKVDEAKALTETDYTTESWAALQRALANAQTVLDKTDAAQADVDAQVTALAAAIDALAAATPVTPDPDPAPTDGYTYGYAALTWVEYWENEGVYNATNTTSRPDIDAHNETDMGGFDAVSRATTNHGVARGAFQCTSVFETTDGTSISVAYWDGTNSFVSADGKTGTYNKGAISYDGKDYTMKDYRLIGTRYVPVAVKSDDLAAFQAKYQFTANGDTLYVGQQGSTAEGNIKPYSAVAAVDANTNGLKTATKNADGSFSFSKAQAGTGSGLQDEAQKVANVTPELCSGSKVGSFGEFIRLDLNGNYGDLGASMQSVTWTYYGSDSTYSNALRTFGTKFAADNWMHSKNGIQLGLTDSDRCALPAGTDGAGYWAVTIHALGYQDYTYKFQAASENIAVPEYVTDATKESLTALITKAEQLNSGLYTQESWDYLQTELSESKDMLEWTRLYESSAKEQAEHLSAALDALVGASGYVWMSIPYADFYKAETGANTTDVDVFSSATKSKTRTGTLAGGSYHKDPNGTDISGIVFPVKVSDLSVLEGKQFVTDDSSLSITTTNRGQTSTATYTGKDALFESEDYSYYVVTGDAPTFYKELTVLEDGSFSFGKVVGTATELRDAAADLTTVSSYGDYQIDVEGLPEEITTVYGVVLNTTDGYGYGLRHLENIWRVSELAICTGHTSEVHGCPTSSRHYMSIEGKTIDTITYYTNAGIYTIPVELKVPEITNVTANVANGSAGNGTVNVSLNGTLPADFDAVYSVAGLDTAYADGKLFYENAAIGKYTLELSDASGKYAPIYCVFVLSTDQVYAAFNGSNETPALTAPEGVDADGFAAYLKAISTVSVNGTSYSASGRGSVKIVNEDGTINLEALSNGAKIFGADGEYKLIVSATGYPELSFIFTVDTKDDAGDNDKPGDADKPGDNTKPGDTEKPGDNTEPSDSTKPGNGGQTNGTQNVSASSATKQDTAKTATSQNVKTGDSSFGVLAASLMLLSGAACAVLLVSKRRKRS